MPPTAPRQISIVYGSLEVGGLSEYELDSWTQVRTGRDEGSFEFTFVVQLDAEEDFAQAVQEIEEAFRTPYQDLEVTLDGAILLERRQSDNTALDTRPEIVKRGQEGDSGVSRVYTVRISYGLPADVGVSTSGLRESAVSVRYSPARKRTIVVSGTFTAVSGNDARAQYESKIATFASAATTAIGGSYNLVDEEAEHDTNDKLLRFSRTYEEIIVNEGGSSLDDPDITRLTLSVATLEEGPGDTPTAGRLLTLTLRSEVWLDKTRTKDLDGKYSSIRAWYVDQIASTLGSSDLAVVSEEVVYDEFENKFNVTMVAKGVSGSETVLENEISAEDALDLGEELVPAWTGDAFSRYRYRGHAELLRTITQTKTVLGKISTKEAAEKGIVTPDGLISGVYLGGLDSSGGQFVERSRRTRVTPRELGIHDERLDVSDVTLTIVLEYWKPIDATPVSGGDYAARGGAGYR